MLSLGDRFEELVMAGVTAIHVQTFEDGEAIEEVRRKCCEPQHQWRLTIFDVAEGLTEYVQQRSEAGILEWVRVERHYAPAAPAQGQTELVWQIQTGKMTNLSQALVSLRGLTAYANAPAKEGEEPESAVGVLVIKNSQLAVATPSLIQQIQNQCWDGRAHRQFVVLMSPIDKLPLELERVFEAGRIEHELPDPATIQEILETSALPEELPPAAERKKIVEAAAGLTRLGAENAFCLSIIRHSVVQPDVIWEMKAMALKKSGMLTMYQGQERFSDLGGLEPLKKFGVRLIRKQGTPELYRRPRGLMLLGVSGAGKSAWCKALGNETGRPVIQFDVAACFAGFVGQTEQNVRTALRVADAVAPCILFIDEVEKALSGSGSSGKTDGGTTARSFGTMLTYLNDHTTDVFVVCTCNDISKLPPEFSRAERFDGIFFLDLPGPEQRAQIWNIYEKMFKIKEQERPRDEDWTGAEIRSCCRLADLLDVPLLEAAQSVVPVARTAAETVSELRQWASGRCLSAEVPGTYQFGVGAGQAAVAMSENGTRRGLQRRRTAGK